MREEGREKILIVDDIISNIRILMEILEQDYEISYLTKGSLAVETAKEQHPDLILLDIMMPEIDGFEVCRMLKAEPELVDIPIIFLTALDETDSVVKGFDLGAVDYVTKPYHPAELKTRIDTHLKLKQSREIIAKKNQELAELLQILCHDYKTPVSFAIGSLELIKDNRELFETFEEDISNALYNALDLIEMVHTLRKLEDFNEKLHLVPILLKTSIDKAIRTLRHRLAKKKIDAVVSIPDSHMIMAEETSLINSVINNILTNAIKFSYPKSQIHISSFEEDDRIVLEVADSGIGMSETMLKDLFVITRATSRKGTDGEGGTGYGMLLINKFVELYSGTFRILSKSEQTHPEGHGTVVQISFQKA